MSDDPRKSDIDRLVNLIATQQETIDYLVQFVERVETELTDRIVALERRNYGDLTQ